VLNLFHFSLFSVMIYNEIYDIVLIVSFAVGFIFLVCFILDKYILALKSAGLAPSCLSQRLTLTILHIIPRFGDNFISCSIDKHSWCSIILPFVMCSSFPGMGVIAFSVWRMPHRLPSSQDNIKMYIKIVWYEYKPLFFVF